MQLEVDENVRRAFYEASLRALRFVDARSPSKRRFGADADAMWKSFRGHLSAADRIDILVRDADIEYGGAFGARVAFGLRGVAEDDAFGAEWRSLERVDADALFRSVCSEPVPTDVARALAACARAWGIELSPMNIPAPKPAEKILVAGPSATAAMAVRFEGETTLSFSDQVACIASPPGHRHLGALASALLRGRRAPRLILSADASSSGSFDRVVTSADAFPDDRVAADRIGSARA